MSKEMIQTPLPCTCMTQVDTLKMTMNQCKFNVKVSSNQLAMIMKRDIGQIIFRKVKILMIVSVMRRIIRSLRKKWRRYLVRKKRIICKKI